MKTRDSINPLSPKVKINKIEGFATFVSKPEPNEPAQVDPPSESILRTITSSFELKWRYQDNGIVKNDDNKRRALAEIRSVRGRQRWPVEKKKRATWRVLLRFAHHWKSLVQCHYFNVSPADQGISSPYHDIHFVIQFDTQLDLSTALLLPSDFHRYLCPFRNVATQKRLPFTFWLTPGLTPTAALGPR